MSSRWQLGLLLGVLVVSIGVIGVWPIRDSPEEVFPDPGDRIRFQLRTLGALIERFQEVNGDFPANMHELVADSSLGIHGEDAITDPWGRPIRYGVSNESYWLHSAGEDGEFDTMDDVEFEAADISSDASGRRPSP